MQTPIKKLKETIWIDIFIFLVLFIFTYEVENISSYKPILKHMDFIPNYTLFFQIAIKNIFVGLIIKFGTKINKYIPIAIEAANGVVLGLVAGKFLHVSYWILIIPHGIIEVPVFITLCYVYRSNKHISKKKTTILWSLIILGAFIEAYITPYLSNIVIH